MVFEGRSRSAVFSAIVIVLVALALILSVATHNGIWWLVFAIVVAVFSPLYWTVLTRPTHPRQRNRNRDEA